MRFPRTARAAMALALACTASSAAADDLLSLDDAFERTLRHRPELRALDLDRVRLGAERENAALPPPLNFDAGVENILGTGGTRGLSGAEATFGLSSLFERGGKRDARRALGQSRIDALDAEAEARRIDLLAEVARRHLDAAFARNLVAIAAQDVEQRRRAADAANERWRAGAAPESVALAAQAALARAELEHDNLLREDETARRLLAASWGGTDAAFEVAAADPTRLPDIEDIGALAALLDASPELRRLASEARIREARTALARSEATPDIGWQIGVRRLQAERDNALVASISIPLGTRSRADSSIRAATLERDALDLERDAGRTALYAVLVEAHGRYRSERERALRLASTVVPELERAERAAGHAFRRGAASHLEWAQVQSDRIAALREREEAARAAQRALIELQRLTGRSFITDADTAPSGATP